MNIRRHTVATGLIGVIAMVGLALSGCTAGSSDDDDFPDKDLELVVYTDPGTSVDQVARQLKPLLEKELGQTVVVINRGGGNGTDALNYLKQKDADGYTLGVWTSTLSGIIAQGVGGAKFDDFDYLCEVVTSPLALYVSNDSQFQDLDSLVEYAKANPKELRASGGAGVTAYAHLFALQFRDAADIDWTWVPFKGSTDVKQALLSGDIDVDFAPATSIENGRMLAVTSSERASIAPDVPTTAELGYDAGDNQAWRGVLVPKGVSDTRDTVLRNAIKKAVETPEWTDFVAKLGAEPASTCDAGFADRVKNEVSAADKYYREIGIID